MAITLITTAGQQAIAEAIANKSTLKIASIAVGDGGGATYTPTISQTALKGQKWSGELNRTVVNPENEKQIIFEGLIAPGVGGFFIREVGLFDENNILIAISDFPESYKATADQYELYVRMILEVANTDVTNIIVKKDMVYATKEYVDNAVNSSKIAEELAAHKAEDATNAKKGHVQLVDDIKGNSTSLVPTENAVRKGIEQTSYKRVKSGKDANGIFTTVQLYRKTDGTLAEKSVLSGGSSPKYTIRTDTYYGLDGKTVEKTDVFTLTYDADGICISEV